MFDDIFEKVHLILEIAILMLIFVYKNANVCDAHLVTIQVLSSRQLVIGQSL